VQIGVVYPQTELGGSPEAVHRLGTAVEALGYDYLLAYDHVLGATHDREPKLTGPYTEQHPFHDPLVLFAYLAGITRRLGLVTGVLILPQRQTALVARQTADIELLSGGRFRLGVGVGWNYVEYESLGQDFKTRGRRVEEQVELLRRLWLEPLVSFQGAFDRVDRARLNPRPARLIPVWFGGFSEAAYRRAARIGDGFIFTGAPERAHEGWARVEHYLHEAGRPVALFGKEIIIGRAEKTPEEVVARVHASAEWHCTHVAIDTMGKGFASVEAHLGFLAEVRARLALPDGQHRPAT
jgi:probable F420-dependent oxidoreductase